MVWFQSDHLEVALGDVAESDGFLALVVLLQSLLCCLRLVQNDEASCHVRGHLLAAEVFYQIGAHILHLLGALQLASRHESLIRVPHGEVISEGEFQTFENRFLVFLHDHINPDLRRQHRLREIAPRDEVAYVE